eukprot:164824-Alexandrium_andersonii.AAC.1
MSASLVGSEMCIRDRGVGVGAARATSWPLQRAAPSRRCSARRAAPCWACLLYTSDAADDM